MEALWKSYQKRKNGRITAMACLPAVSSGWVMSQCNYGGGYDHQENSGYYPRKDHMHQLRGVHGDSKANSRKNRGGKKCLGKQIEVARLTPRLD